MRGYVPSIKFIPLCRFFSKFSSLICNETQRVPRSDAETFSSELIGVNIMAADSRYFMKSLKSAWFYKITQLRVLQKTWTRRLSLSCISSSSDATESSSDSVNIKTFSYSSVGAAAIASSFIFC